jgi:hypothetical protein
MFEDVTLLRKRLQLSLPSKLQEDIMTCEAQLVTSSVSSCLLLELFKISKATLPQSCSQTTAKRDWARDASDRGSGGGRRMRNFPGLNIYWTSWSDLGLQEELVPLISILGNLQPFDHDLPNICWLKYTDLHTVTLSLTRPASRRMAGQEVMNWKDV